MLARSSARALRRTMRGVICASLGTDFSPPPKSQPSQVGHDLGKASTGPFRRQPTQDGVRNSSLERSVPCDAACREGGLTSPPYFLKTLSWPSVLWRAMRTCCIAPATGRGLREQQDAQMLVRAASADAATGSSSRTVPDAHRRPSATARAGKGERHHKALRCVLDRNASY